MNRNKSTNINKQTRRNNNNNHNDFPMDIHDPFSKFKDFDKFFNDFNNDDMFGGDSFFNMKRLGDDNFKNMIK